MDEGLLLVLIVPTFVIVLPIVISSFAPFVILILSSILTAFIGWIIIKIFRG